MTVGRRESCDIVLRFSNVSGQHCQLLLEGGYWFVQDNNSQNGTKVAGDFTQWHNYAVEWVDGRITGYVDGQNIAIEPRGSDDIPRLYDLATDLVKSKVDVIVTQGTPGVQAAQRATRTTPIVMAASGARAARGRTRAWSTRRIRQPHAGVGRGGRARRYWIT
jgi:hypothetical protein